MNWEHCDDPNCLMCQLVLSLEVIEFQKAERERDELERIYALEAPC